MYPLTASKGYAIVLAMPKNVQYVSVKALQVGVQKTTRQCIVSTELDGGGQLNLAISPSLAADLLAQLQSYFDRAVPKQ